ncbi:MAG: hypothetical protein V4594_00610 [Bacteroidota bacterium]
MSNDVWNINSENKEHIDRDMAQFVLEQADKSLKHTIDIADKATNRAFTLLLIYLPVTSTLVGILINEIKESHKFRILDIYFLGSLVVVCMVALLALIRLIFPRASMVLGREPKDILTNDMLQNSLTAENKLKAFHLNEIKNYQARITYNREQNAKRIALISTILKWTGIAAFISIITYLIILSQWVVQ